jgi:hypothetical protein
MRTRAHAGGASALWFEPQRENRPPIPRDTTVPRYNTFADIGCVRDYCSVLPAFANNTLHHGTKKALESSAATGNQAIGGHATSHFNLCCLLHFSYNCVYSRELLLARR